MDNSIFNRRPYTSKQQKALNIMYSLSGVAADEANIMLRINTLNLPASAVDLASFTNVDDLDAFVFTTSADPENTIIYESLVNTVNLNVRDGGYF
jgi:citrate lyase beta subunit